MYVAGRKKILIFKIVGFIVKMQVEIISKRTLLKFEQNGRNWKKNYLFITVTVARQSEKVVPSAQNLYIQR